MHAFSCVPVVWCVVEFMVQGDVNGTEEIHNTQHQITSNIFLISKINDVVEMVTNIPTLSQ
jgi:hypothetical protein